MSVFEHPAYNEHESVHFHHDKRSGLHAIVAIHSTRFGPALGGCRIWSYDNDDQALADVLRLSQGMTYKAAIANVPVGGGKAVIMLDKRGPGKTRALLHAMGDFIQQLGGRYITAEDVGTSVDDLHIVAERTQFVTGIERKKDIHGNWVTGDPSPATALGVFIGIETAVKHRLGVDNLQGIRVAVQGMGNVGYRVANLLHAAGAQLWVSDINPKNLQRAVTELNATAVKPTEIHSQPVDVFAPCALGSAISEESIDDLQVAVIAGSANNQLQHSQLGLELQQRDILYAPDFVINGGGLIDVYQQMVGHDPQLSRRHIESIGENLVRIFSLAAKRNLPTEAIAYELAEHRLAQGPSADTAIRACPSTHLHYLPN